ncbi:MAG TPA: AAA family ATPase [Solirubrobacterales bacterium]|nr:AAA family ATPase [Solirubrobacterales bacterium]
MRSSSADPVLILTGPPGVGKSSAAALLADRFDRAVHLRADEFFHFVRAGFVEPWRPESQAQNEAVIEIVGRAAAGYADAGYFTIVDGIVIPHRFLERLSGVIRGAGHEVAYVVLKAASAVCAARVQSREAPAPIEPAVLDQLWAEFADLGEYERHVLDVEGLDPTAVADALERALATRSYAL